MFKALTVSCVALLLTVLASTADSAEASWFVGGTQLTGTAALATTAAVEDSVVLSIPAIHIVVSCEGSTLGAEKPEIVSTNTLKAKSVIFKECWTSEPATRCALENQPINIPTEPIRGVMSLGLTKTTADQMVLSPQTKKILATIPFATGNTCALEGEEPLAGNVTVRAPTGQSEETLQAIKGLGSMENNSLEIAGIKTFVEACPVLKLASGSKWGFH